jgi:F-type H+-transporting ATPase subunit b
MKSRGFLTRAGGAALVAAALLTGSAAVAQQPAPQPAPRPAQPAPGQMPGLPLGHPAVQPPGGAPQQPPRGVMPPGGVLPPGGRPTLPAFNPHAAPQGSAHKEPKPEHCPGHGPLDAPHHVNWWHGMLMVNNERAEKGGINSLLFRYNNEENPCDPKNEPPPFLASLLNFGLLAFVLYRFGRKPISEALAKRKQSIMQEIDNATRLREEAEARLGEYEEKFEKIEETLEELKAELALQAEVEKKHMLTEAEERRARMKRDAEFRIEQELKAAKAELLQVAVESAVHAAEELLRKSAGAQDQDRMMKEYLSAIPVALKDGAAPAASAGAAGGRS